MDLSKKYLSIDEYIKDFPLETQEKLVEIRKIVHEVAPNAIEAISYGMPTFKLGGNLVHFAGYKKHIGFYPTPSPIESFKKELSEYKTSKGAVQFPLDKPLPLDLIRRMVISRVRQLEAKM
ncbi:DUF1801 domain-containing protein [Candidatus Dojkabacteria bacterium]|nr:DUF1801 domain-containing protein [Candidatus Dojkabacteria bacterium]